MFHSKYEKVIKFIKIFRHYYKQYPNPVGAYIFTRIELDYLSQYNGNLSYHIEFNDGTRIIPYAVK